MSDKMMHIWWKTCKGYGAIKFCKISPDDKKPENRPVSDRISGFSVGNKQKIFLASPAINSSHCTVDSLPTKLFERLSESAF